MNKDNSEFILPFPQVVRIEPAASCNFKCIHCPTGLDLSPTGIMDMETFNKIALNLEKIITKQGHKLSVIVLYHGGEPLLNKNFFEMVSRSKKLAKLVKTVTNGSRLKDETIEKVAHSDLDQIEISLDGISAQENNRIRLNPVGATFETVAQQIISLIKKLRVKGRGVPKVFISNTQIPETLEQVEKDPKPPQYMLTAFNEVSEDINYKCTWALTWPGMPIKGLKKPIRNHCDHIVNTITIRSNGDVVACCYDLMSKLPIGNIATQDIEEIWNNKRYQGLRRTINEFKPPELCRNCDVLYKFIPILKSDILP